MNIDDAAGPDSIPVNVWPAIWNYQKALHEKYKAIEAKSGIGYGVLNFHYDADPPMDNPTFQYYLKDLFWRVVEELAEATEATVVGHEQHYVEEMIDALHFMVEIFVVLNKPLPDLEARMIPFPEPWNSTEYRLGLAANCLKNKPWKQTHMETDVTKFTVHLEEAFHILVIDLMSADDCPADTRGSLDWIFTMYVKKRQVNEFRQRSNY